MKKLIVLLALFCMASSPTPVHVGYSKTFSDLRDFLAFDDLSLRPWSTDFQCEGFADELVKRARAHGFVAVKAQTGWVEGDGHFFNAIYTKDLGAVWVEPQTDAIYDQSMRDNHLCRTDGWCWPYTAAFVTYHFEDTVTLVWSRSYIVYPN